jgi:acylglycerol lipase
VSVDDTHSPDPRVPSVLAPTTQDWNLRSGSTVHLWEAPKATAALVLQHGFGEYAERFVTSYRQLIPRLLENGFDVYGMDMRGHGRSAGRRGVVDVREAVEDHLTVRRTLTRESLPVYLFGHSLGGLVTAASVAREPHRVQGVVLTSPALPNAPHPATRALLRLLAAVAPHGPIPARPADPSGISRDPEVRTEARQDPLLYKGVLNNRTAESAIQSTQQLFDRAAQWTAPTLLLHGTGDTFTDPHRTQALFTAIAAQDKTLALIPGGYHELLNDTEGDQTLQTILTWLHAHKPPTTGMAP